jgi:hypothetical protein
MRFLSPRRTGIRRNDTATVTTDYLNNYTQRITNSNNLRLQLIYFQNWVYS